MLSWRQNPVETTDLLSFDSISEMQHNMTHEEREDLYHWYNEAKEGKEVFLIGSEMNDRRLR